MAIDLASDIIKKLFRGAESANYIVNRNLLLAEHFRTKDKYGVKKHSDPHFRQDVHSDYARQ